MNIGAFVVILTKMGNESTLIDFRLRGNDRGKGEDWKGKETKL